MLPWHRKRSTRMGPARRWLQFSLRTILLLLAALSVWLACCVNQARRQREAITELHQLHVAVLYRQPGTRSNEQWHASVAQRLFGVAFREPVEYVGFQHASRLMDDPRNVERALSLLRQLRGLQRLNLEGMPVGDRSLHELEQLVDLRMLNLMYTHVSDAGAAKLRKALPDCQIIR